MATRTQNTIKMPEFLVFIRMLLVGFIGTETVLLAYRGSLSFGRLLVKHGHFASIIGIVCLLAICTAAYAHRRGAFAHLRRMLLSRRIDLLMFVVLGYLVSTFVAPDLAPLYAAADRLPWFWSPTVLLGLLTLVGSGLKQGRGAKQSELQQLKLLTDTEIDDQTRDGLSVAGQAERFADTVLAANGNTSLVFGVDGPWGIGKTSFLNLAEKRWVHEAGGSIIVFKFQPLRYANDTDLSERLIRELCATLQQQVFAPEFLPAANRYSRMLKGKADLSFLGFKLSLEPSNETVDEMLEDIEAVLGRVGRRLIVIIEDLDRLDAKLVNNVLFTVRRTLNLTQATYILCYDTEMLVAGKDEGTRAREFLEKFITVKFSLFLEGKSIAKFLRSEWDPKSAGSQLVPSGSKKFLSLVLEEVAKILEGQETKHYMPLLGDMRKIKRFVNAMVMMRLPDQDIERSDFQYRDLINLVLIHLFYPGLFRRIYAEESEGRVGIFSLQRGDDKDTANLANSDEFGEILKGLEAPAAHLLRQLFDVRTLGFTSYKRPTTGDFRTRACFNTGSKNLENYLALIVRLVVPAPEATYRLYIEAVQAIIRGDKQVSAVLQDDEFSLSRGDKTHSQFWDVLVNEADQLSRVAADQVISTLVAYLPRYSCHDRTDYSLRQQSVSSLARLLDRAGFSEPRNGRPRDSADAGEIGQRIFGHASYHPKAIIDQLVAADRGPLGWNDLMLFRLRCSIDRGGNLHSLYSGLLRYEDVNAVVTGVVGVLATNSMRRLSQEIFKRFRTVFIDGKLSFFAAVNEVSDEEVFGDAGPPDGMDTEQLTESVAVARSIVKDFVIYQLTNSSASNQSGVGCGFYDEAGSADGAGIAKLMKRYLLYFCFNPLVHESNALEFGDFCLRNMRQSLFESMGERTPAVAEAALAKFWTTDELAKYWSTFGPTMKKKLRNLDRSVISSNYKTTYSESMPFFFAALDRLVTAAATADTKN